MIWLTMSKLKDFGIFVLGLILIICGFLSFVSIPVVAHRGIDMNYNILIATGCVLIILGSVSMYFFLQTEDKKKKSPKKKPPDDIEVV